jgi:urea carboxylase
VFDKVLVANRGEIACRIMATLRRMGVTSVAVYTDADVGSLHVAAADEAVRIGEGPVATSYLAGERVLEAARATEADAIHPGYGFLSESAVFAAACADAHVTWIGPSPEHLRDFGDKHTARTLAAAAGVPMLAGSGLLASVDAALVAADDIGYPVMLKATAGGGGIGMQRCCSAAELAAAFETVARLATRHFGQGGLYVERFVNRARHVEVQIFGITVLGLRDCSAQRRHQKVIEETPPWGVPPALLSQLETWATALASSVGYRSAGTVEFVVDIDRDDAAFLEVNTRLQVEHGVTELVTGIDLVEWMVREAAGAPLPPRGPAPGGVAIEARVYAEDPAHRDRPGVGPLVAVAWPSDARVDTWVTRGTDVTPWYDPMLAKILVWGPTRVEAVASMAAALGETKVEGVATNLAFLRDVVASPGFVAGGYSTDYLTTVPHAVEAIEVLAPGMQTTVQDCPGRLGYWAVGVPPSGPMDDLAFRRANALVGNEPDAAGLEITSTGPTLRFDAPAVVALAGAPMGAWVDDVAVAWDMAIAVEAGSVLRVGSPVAGGCRAYFAVRGGLDVPTYLGSRSTFMLGGFGGLRGRALAAGDVLPVRPAPLGSAAAAPAPLPAPPDYGDEWTFTVTDGPHGAPDFFTAEGIDEFFGATWEVHHHSDRTGIRLIGPTPKWARPDGGEAGLHPSNIHDTVYAVGTVDFTGDMPVILGPDGPSLGGFTCPVTVVGADRWKFGQLRPGDRIRFAPAPGSRDPVLRRTATAPEVTYRRAGDRCLLVEFGPNVLDLELRVRAHALMSALESAAIPGIEELAPGIRSLQVRYDPAVLREGDLVDAVQAVEAGLPGAADTVVPSRVVRLPLSWDDPATRLAIERYMHLVRDDAPWCPWNIEFIRRINGLDSVDDVRRIVFDASYLVLGLGDVYLGAPVATPLDPRHRLVTTKYNPARTWTAENSVGIGGAYLCVYGMEGPGGYQFVGRTIQMWNRYRETPDFQGSQRWLLRFFDQLHFFPVSAEELLDLRRDFPVGRYQVDITETSLSLSDHQRFLDDHQESIVAFKRRQQQAFEEERARWEASGELARGARVAPAPATMATGSAAVPDGMVGISTPVYGMVARVAAVGEAVSAGDPVVVVEAMKTETAVASPSSGTVSEVRCQVGDIVRPGTPLVVLEPA